MGELGRRDGSALGWSNDGGLARLRRSSRGITPRSFGISGVWSRTGRTRTRSSRRRSCAPSAPIDLCPPTRMCERGSSPSPPVCAGHTGRCGGRWSARRRAYGRRPRTVLRWKARRPPLEGRSPLEDIIGGLPLAQRLALAMRKLHDLDYAAIGDCLDCSAETARTHVLEAMRKIRRGLEVGGSHHGSDDRRDDDGRSASPAHPRRSRAGLG